LRAGRAGGGRHRTGDQQADRPGQPRRLGRGPRVPPKVTADPPHPEDTTFRDCWVAFIHGAGSNYASEPRLAEAYWRPTGEVGNVSRHQLLGLPRYVTNQDTSCHSAMIGYDGTENFEHDAGYVAWQLRSFIERERIPDGRMVIIAHSMGGLVSRYLMNTGEPNSPTSLEARWTAEDLETISLVKNKTSHVITIQTPHFGAEGADALWGESSSGAGDLSGVLATFIGEGGHTRSSFSLRRSYLEMRADNMGDEGRTVPRRRPRPVSFAGQLS
jgi:hypothetical protein